MANTTRAQRLRRRKLEAQRSIPRWDDPDLEGTYLLDPDTGEDVYVSFDELHGMAASIMDYPDPRGHETGKPVRQYDPTYDMRRKNR